MRTGKCRRLFFGLRDHDGAGTLRRRWSGRTVVHLRAALLVQVPVGWLDTAQVGPTWPTWIILDQLVRLDQLVHWHLDQLVHLGRLDQLGQLGASWSIRIGGPLGPRGHYSSNLGWFGAVGPVGLSAADSV